MRLLTGDRARLVRLLLICGAVALATALRLHAVERLPADFDEDDYLRAGQQYAAAIRTGEWRPVLDQEELSEHPALGKLVFAAVLLPLPEAPLIPQRELSAPPDEDLPRPHATVARLTSALLGVAAVALIATVDPLAGLFLAIGTWPIKYTSQVYVEALGSLLALGSVLAYTASGSERRRGRWLAISAICLGLAGATKYVYALAGIAIVADWLWTRATLGRPARLAQVRPALPAMTAWAILSLLAFLLADPQLWADPIGRLGETILYHAEYATGVAPGAGYGPGQPFLWLTTSVPWHPGTFVIEPDRAVTILAALGLPIAFVRHRVVALWLAIGLAFLVAWPTKWPQYTLVVYAPLSLVAADGVRWLAGLVARAVTTRSAMSGVR